MPERVADRSPPPNEPEADGQRTRVSPGRFPPRRNSPHGDSTPPRIPRSRLPSLRSRRRRQHAARQAGTHHGRPRRADPPKLEFLDPGGSKKNRIALQIVRDAEAEGRLAPGQLVVELISGNTGAGLAIVCGLTGHPFVAVKSKGNTPKRAQMMRALGAEPSSSTSRMDRRTGRSPATIWRSSKPRPSGSSAARARSAPTSSSSNRTSAPTTSTPGRRSSAKPTASTPSATSSGPADRSPAAPRRSLSTILRSPATSSNRRRARPLPAAKSSTRATGSRAAAIRADP